MVVLNFLPKTVVVPGFPRGGGANTQGGPQNMILPNFPKNYMKFKKFGPPGGASLSLLLDPQLQNCKKMKEFRPYLAAPRIGQ